MVRTAGDPALLAAAVRREIGRIDQIDQIDRIGRIGPDLPVVEMRPLVHGREAAVAGPRAILLLLALFAALGLALVALGVYDLLASGVGERQREIAVRMVLGASAPGVLRLVLSRGLLLSAQGMAAGLAASALLARHLPPVLYEVSPTDAAAYLAIYLATAAVLLGATLLAALHPARRATRIAPAVTLAGE